MKKPSQVLFQKDQFNSIGEVERRLAVITEMQRLLQQDEAPNVKTNSRPQSPTQS